MAWSTYKTHGIVVSVEPWREADRRYRILTPTHGKVEAVGRGARKGKAKLASHLEPFAVVDLEIVRGRASTTIIGVERKERFADLERDLDRRLLVSSALHLADRLTREGDLDDAMYGEVLAWLRFVNGWGETRPLRATFLSGAFLLRCLKHIGFEPELAACLSCREKIMPLSFRWHGSKGGLTCTDCVRTKGADWQVARAMCEESVKLLRLASIEPYADMLRYPLKAIEVEEFAGAVHDTLCAHVPGDWYEPFWSAVLAQEKI